MPGNVISAGIGTNDMDIAVGPAEDGTSRQISFIRSGDEADPQDDIARPFFDKGVMTMPRTDEILAHAEELADRFESDDFDADMMTPAEYELACAARERAAVEVRVRNAVTALVGTGVLAGPSR